MRSSLPLIGLLGCLLGGSRLVGMQVEDLRLEYAPIMGTEFQYSGNVHVTSLFGQNSDTREAVGTAAQHHDRYALSYRKSWSDLRAGFGSPLYGVDVATDRISETQANIHHYRATTIMVDAFLGWAWRIMPGWHLEQGLMLGGGRVHWNQRIQQYYNDGADWNDDTTSFAYEYGFSVGTYYTFAEHLQIGLDVRDMVNRSTTRFVGAHTSQSNGDAEVTSAKARFDVQGFGATMALGYRF